MSELERAGLSVVGVASERLDYRDVILSTMEGAFGANRQLQPQIGLLFQADADTPVS